MHFWHCAQDPESMVCMCPLSRQPLQYYHTSPDMILQNLYHCLLSILSSLWFHLSLLKQIILSGVCVAKTHASRSQTLIHLRPQNSLPRYNFARTASQHGTSLKNSVDLIDLWTRAYIDKTLQGVLWWSTYNKGDPPLMGLSYFEFIRSPHLWQVFQGTFAEYSQHTTLYACYIYYISMELITLSMELITLSIIYSSQQRRPMYQQRKHDLEPGPPSRPTRIDKCQHSQRAHEHSSSE